MIEFQTLAIGVAIGVAVLFAARVLGGVVWFIRVSRPAPRGRRLW